MTESRIWSKGSYNATLILHWLDLILNTVSSSGCRSSRKILTSWSVSREEQLEWWRGWACVACSRGEQGGDMIAVFNYVKGNHVEEGANLFIAALETKTRSNGSK